MKLFIRTQRYLKENLTQWPWSFLTQGIFLRLIKVTDTVKTNAHLHKILLTILGISKNIEVQFLDRSRELPVSDDRAGCLPLVSKFLVFHRFRCVLCGSFSSNPAIFLPFLLALLRCSPRITFSFIAWKTLIIRFKS